MPFFMSPSAFWGLLAAIVLAGVYFFRRQSRTIKVSSLMFFSRLKHPAEGGRRLTRFQAPLILLVEAAILILLVIAAASPRAISGEKLVPVVLILDDSLSMGVNEPDSPRAAALKYLDQTFFSQSAYRFTMIRAGFQPEIIGRHEMTGKEAAWLVSNWRCRAPTADLRRAMRYVGEGFSANVHTFVITDHIPENEQTGRSVWLAFGKALDNLAITSVSRYALGTTDRCFAEFTSFASGPVQLEAEIIDYKSGQVLERISETLPSGAIRRIRFIVKDTSATINIRIAKDKVEFDNNAWLLPVRLRPVDVELRLKNENFKRVIERAVFATGLARISSSSTQLLITDSKDSVPAEEGLWHLYLHVASQPSAISGVIAVDKEHPLVTGFPPVKAAWAIDPEFTAVGKPLMSAATTSLLSVEGDPEQRVAINMNMTPDYSDLHKSPIWPVMFWNLMNWRQQFFPGPLDANFRSGNQIKLALPAGEKAATMLDPAGKKIEEASVWRNQAVFQSSLPGLFQIKTEIASWPVAVNLCSPAESDLSGASSLPPPAMPFAEDAMLQFADVRWWFLLPAMLLIALHQWLSCRRRPADAAR